MGGRGKISRREFQLSTDFIQIFVSAASFTLPENTDPKNTDTENTDTKNQDAEHINKSEQINEFEQINECEHAHAKSKNSSDLKAEQNPAKKEGSAGPAVPPSGWRPVDPEEEVILMKSDDLCREHFFRQTRLPIDRFDTLLSDFLLKVKSESHQHNNRKDFRSHFFNWARTRNGGADAMRPGAPTGQPAGPSYANLKTYGS